MAAPQAGLPTERLCDRSGSRFYWEPARLTPGPDRPIDRAGGTGGLCAVGCCLSPERGGDLVFEVTPPLSRYDPPFRCGSASGMVNRRCRIVRGLRLESG